LVVLLLPVVARRKRGTASVDDGRPFAGKIKLWTICLADEFEICNAKPVLVNLSVEPEGAGAAEMDVVDGRIGMVGAECSIAAAAFTSPLFFTGLVSGATETET